MSAFSVTEAFVSWLSSLGWRASTRVPEGASGTFVTVGRTGGAPRDMVDYPTMAVQVWSPTEAGADEAANDLRAQLLTEEPPPGIHSVRVNSGPYPFFDEETRMPRYQMALDVVSMLGVR